MPRRSSTTTCYTAEALDRLLHGALRVLVDADVPRHSERCTAGSLDLGGGSVHGARQSSVRLTGLGQQDDVGGVLSSAHRDRHADAPTSPT